MKEYFSMIMLVELSDMNIEFSLFAETLKKTGEDNGIEIRVMHEDIFNSMHRI